MRRMTESSAGVSLEAMEVAMAALSLISVSGVGLVELPMEEVEGTRLWVGVLVDAVVVDAVSVVAPKRDNQLEPEAGPTMEGMDGDGMANSFGDVLGAVPADCPEFTDVTDADDGTTAGAGAGATTAGVAGVRGSGGRAADGTCASADTLATASLPSFLP